MRRFDWLGLMLCDWRSVLLCCVVRFCSMNCFCCCVEKKMVFWVGCVIWLCRFLIGNFGRFLRLFFFLSLWFCRFIYSVRVRVRVCLTEAENLCLDWDEMKQNAYCASGKWIEACCCDNLFLGLGLSDIIVWTKIKIIK